MKLAIMQPYFFPYIGYFQLINAVDQFVLYDNIKYTKKGWINRNRLLRNGGDAIFSLPLKHAPDSLDIKDRALAADFDPEKIISVLDGAYRKAPYYEQCRPMIVDVLRQEDRNLFRFLHYGIAHTCAYLGITTEITVSSGIQTDHQLKCQDRVLALCTAVGASTYINAIGGTTLYSKDAFSTAGVELKFIRSTPFEYAQMGNEFIPWLSIVDVMAFNSKEQIHQYINRNFELV